MCMRGQTFQTRQPGCQRAQLAQAWSRGLPAYLDIAQLNPGLHTLLSMRWELGLRNPGHTIAKLLATSTVLSVSLLGNAAYADGETKNEPL